MLRGQDEVCHRIGQLSAHERHEGLLACDLRSDRRRSSLRAGAAMLHATQRAGERQSCWLGGGDDEHGAHLVCVRASRRWVGVFGRVILNSA